MPARSLQAPHPYLEADGLELHCDPATTWERLLADLRAARRRVLLESYIIREGKACDAVVAALCDAAARGARVRVLADAFGSMSLGGTTLARLRAAGVELRFFNPIRLQKLLVLGSFSRFLQRTHRRIVVVDEEVAWVGGMAIDDRWWPGGIEPVARDTMLRLSGTALVESMAACFGRLWNWRWMRKPKLRRRLRIGQAERGAARLVEQSARRAPHFRRCLYNRLARARERAWFGTAYFIPNRRLRLGIRNAAKRGVSVRLLLPGSRIDHPIVRVAAHRYYSQLLRDGVRIFEYEKAFMHGKFALFDDEWSVVGSPNLDRWSLYLNHELAVEARNPQLAADLHAQFLEDFRNSSEVIWEEWSERPKWRRFLEEFFGLLESAL